MRLDRNVDIFMTGGPHRWVRPVGLAELGSDSLFAEPYTIRSPHRVHIGSDVRIDRDSLLSVVEDYGGEKLDPTLRIGDGARIGADLLLHCAGGIDIGDRVSMSARIYIGDSFREYDDPTVSPGEMPMAEPEPIRICNDAFVGAGSAILPGVTIGERAIVSAGSVVTRDVPPLTVVFGNPARVVRSWDEKAGEWVIGPLRR